MLFNSFAFIAFFALTYSGYVMLRARLRAQNDWLLAASWFFYGWWDWRFLGLLILSSSVDYFSALRIRALDPRDSIRRRRWLLLTLATNLAILGFFKYFGFFAQNAVALCRAFGLHVDAPTLQIILPVGLSFYTFQSIGYVVDVYRGDLEPVADYRDYALFVAFFPHMVAGPIQRASNLLAQITTPRTLRWEQIHDGVFLIVWGYVKKVVIADNAAIIADAVFNQYSHYHGLDIVLGTLAFALQIYGDFSGYSDIARGVSKLMGFELMLNFRLPYFAISPSDFWQRWHVSLSTWLRDYLYIPLGGNRGSELQTYRNLMLTMLLGGLWHGASWNFVLWGLFHGAILVAYRIAKFAVRHAEPGGPDWSVFRIIPQMAMMFALTLFGWLLFRAHSMSQLGHMLGAISPRRSATTAGYLGRLAALWGPLLAIEAWQYRRHDLLAPAKLPPFAQFGLYAMMLSSIVLFGVRTHTEFIYFQF